MSGFLFLIALDWVMRKALEDGERGIIWNVTSKLSDLDFADEICVTKLNSKAHSRKKGKLIKANC